MTLKQLHEEGMKLRESDRLEEAAAVLTQAIARAIESEEHEELAGSLGDRSLTWKHYYLLHKKDEYFEMCLHDALMMLDVTQTYQVDKLLPKAQFMVGEAYMLVGDYSQATSWFEKAVNSMPDSAEKGSFIYHLGEALYRMGKKEEGKAAFKQGIDTLIAHEPDTDSFVYHVWLSGAYMRLAELLRDDEPELSREYLEKAREIIDADDRLVIRKRQWEELKKLITL